VTFVDYNGTVLDRQTVESGSNATAPAAPSRVGYVFTGWDRGFTNVTGNLTVTAQYEVIVIEYQEETIFDEDHQDDNRNLLRVLSGIHIILRQRTLWTNLITAFI